MSEEKPNQISGTRLRIGVLSIFIWWAPFWALAPAIAGFFDLKVSYATIAIVCLQTALGLLGVLIAGKDVVAIMKKPPRRQLLRNVMHVLIHGSF